AWADLGARAGELAGRAEPEVRAYGEALRAWAAELEGASPALLAAVAAEHDRIAAAGGELGRSPVAPLLYQRGRGRLGLDDLRARCPTPGRTLDLAAALGVALPAQPATERTIVPSPDSLRSPAPGDGATGS